MNKIQYVKAFFNPNKHESMIREYLVTKTALEHNDFLWMKGSYEESFTNEMGVVSFWYDKPIENGRTTGAMIFYSAQWYKLVLQGKIRKLIRLVIDDCKVLQGKIRNLIRRFVK